MNATAHTDGGRPEDEDGDETMSTEIETETGSPIESGIEEEPWGHYAYVDDGEHAIVVGVNYADEEDLDNVSDVAYAVYACEAGLVDRIEGPATQRFRARPNNLADAAIQILESFAKADGRHPIAIARDYWADQ